MTGNITQDQWSAIIWGFIGSFIWGYYFGAYIIPWFKRKGWKDGNNK